MNSSQPTTEVRDLSPTILVLYAHTTAMATLTLLVFILVASYLLISDLVDQRKLRESLYHCRAVRIIRFIHFICATILRICLFAFHGFTTWVIMSIPTREQATRTLGQNWTLFRCNGGIAFLVLAVGDISLLGGITAENWRQMLEFFFARALAVAGAHVVIWSFGLLYRVHYYGWEAKVGWTPRRLNAGPVTLKWNIESGAKGRAVLNRALNEPDVKIMGIERITRRVQRTVGEIDAEGRNRTILQWMRMAVGLPENGELPQGYGEYYEHSGEDEGEEYDVHHDMDRVFRDVGPYSVPYHAGTDGIGGQADEGEHQRASERSYESNSKEDYEGDGETGSSDDGAVHSTSYDGRWSESEGNREDDYDEIGESGLSDDEAEHSAGYDEGYGESEREVE